MKNTGLLNNKGMTLVEAMVSVLILSLGIIPSLTVIILASNLSGSIRNNLIAANLAQEGIEVVRAIRDANWFNSQPFDSGLANGTYRVQWDSTSLIAETGSNPVLEKDASGLYSYSPTGADSSFKRRIFILKDTTVPGCNCELRVITEVIWPEKGRTRTITVEAHLFDWK